MAESNYEIAKEKMREGFLTYDQQKMIDQWKLRHDEAYLYLEFIGHSYRLKRITGVLQWSEDGFVTCREAEFDEAASIYDLLCDSKEDCHLTGNFVTINNLKGTVYSSGLGEDMFQRYAGYFDHRLEELRAACVSLGGSRERVGDVSYRIPVFPFLPVIFQFWEGDEEFPPSLKVLWDEGTLGFIRYETTYYVVGHLLERILELMG